MKAWGMNVGFGKSKKNSRQFGEMKFKPEMVIILHKYIGMCKCKLKKPFTLQEMVTCICSLCTESS